MSEIERKRSISAYSLRYSEGEILKGMMNKKNLTKSDLDLANSRISGSRKISGIPELKKRIDLYNEYTSKKSEQERTDVYINPRRLTPKVIQLYPKSNKP